MDDSIVVLENIYRHRAMGEAKREAVLTGTREVAGAITSSTVTTVAVFLPIGFVGGIVSQFFLPFGLAVTFALLASLIVALTVIPVLAYWFVDKVDVTLDEHGELPETIWQRLYTPALLLALRRRATKWGTLAITLVLFVVAMSLAPLLPTSFVDAGGEHVLTVTISPPAGASTEGVREKTEQAEVSDRQRGRRARPIDHPWRGGHRSAVAPGGLLRSRDEQRRRDGAPRGRGGSRGIARGAEGRAGAHRDRWV